MYVMYACVYVCMYVYARTYESMYQCIRETMKHNAWAKHDSLRSYDHAKLHFLGS